INMKKFIIIFDGPPASGKTTRSRILVRKLCCPVIQYRAIGLANFISTVIFRLTPAFLETNINHIKGDPVLFIKRQVLERIRSIIFLTELLYKFLQTLKLLIFSLSFKCLIIDEFFILRTANYINVYLYGGLKKWQVILLMRLDIALLRMLSHIGNLHYTYINRHTNELRRLWYKRSHSKDYPSGKYLMLIQIVWRKNKEIIYKFAKFINYEDY
ncbi:MAG: hypothetical protein QXV04_04700, partial [Desulfurococcaceae archaeon]